jgi:hypothetical protein
VLIGQLSMLRVLLGHLKALICALLKPSHRALLEGNYCFGIDPKVGPETRFKNRPSTARLGCNQMHFDM